MVSAGIHPFRENSHGRTGNRTRDLMISRQRLWPRGWSDKYFITQKHRLQSMGREMSASNIQLFSKLLTPVFCVSVCGYWDIKGTCCLRFQEIKVHFLVDLEPLGEHSTNHLPSDAVSYCRTPETLTARLWKPLNLQTVCSYGSHMSSIQPGYKGPITVL